jgi:fatty-acyl-CoA synthase
MIIDGFGASETGGQGSQISIGGARPRPAFRMNDDTMVLSEDLSAPADAGSGETGLARAQGHVPLGYFKDAEKSAKTFPQIGDRR